MCCHAGPEQSQRPEGVHWKRPPLDWQLLRGSAGRAIGRSAVAAPTGRRVALFRPRLSACVHNSQQFTHVNSGMIAKWVGYASQYAG